jgi:hypothetical protein
LVFLVRKQTIWQPWTVFNFNLWLCEVHVRTVDISISTYLT